MPNGCMYSAIFDAVAVTAAQDVFEIVAPSDAIVVIHKCSLFQTSDYGDAQAEGLKVQIVRGYTSSGSAGTSPSKAAFATNSAAAAGATVEANNTSQANTGSVDTLVQDGFNVQIGWYYRPTPEERIPVAPSVRLVVKITAPADSITLSGELVWEEIG